MNFKSNILKYLLFSLLGLLVIGGIVLGLHHKQQIKIQQQQQQTRKEFLERFGIVPRGDLELVAMPPELPHGVREAKLGFDLFTTRDMAHSSHRSCVYCHPLNTGGIDGKLHGGKLTRSAYNAVFANQYLHNGSLTGTPTLIKYMIENSDFANCGKLDRAVQRLAMNSQRVADFKACYPDGLTTNTIVDAIGQYLRTLITHNTPFDWHQSGNEDAYTPIQKQGLTIFRNNNCLKCHDGPALGTLKVVDGVKVPALRGLNKRTVYWVKTMQTDLNAAVMLMPNCPELETERSALVAFLKTL